MKGTASSSYRWTPMKYDPLHRYLCTQMGSSVPMTFQQVESIIGGALPASARRHRPWWANDATGHAHAKAWLKAGYRTEQVDMEGEKLVFVRADGVMEADMMEKGMAESSAAYKAQEAQAQHPMIGALKGLLWIDPSLDLTKPALDPDEWDQILDEKYGKDERGT
jgi:hypothetical protein